MIRASLVFGGRNRVKGAHPNDAHASADNERAAHTTPRTRHTENGAGLPRRAPSGRQSHKVSHHRAWERAAPSGQTPFSR